MKNKPILLLVIGLIALVAGGALHFTSGPPRADAALAQQCRDSIQARGPAASDLLPRCDELAFARMTTAPDAQSAARAIASANRGEIGGDTSSMFLLGLGAALTLGGLILTLRRTR